MCLMVAPTLNAQRSTLNAQHSTLNRSAIDHRCSVPFVCFCSRSVHARSRTFTLFGGGEGAPLNAQLVLSLSLLIMHHSSLLPWTQHLLSLSTLNSQPSTDPLRHSRNTLQNTLRNTPKNTPKCQRNTLKHRKTRSKKKRGFSPVVDRSRVTGLFRAASK
jgi:hypothetical protein